MRFLRENIFLIGTAAACVAIGALLALSYFSASGKLDAAIRERERLSKTLDDFAGRKGANEAMISWAKRRVERVERDGQRVRRECVNWNRRNYSVLKLDVTDSSGVRRRIDAFPIDEQQYEELSLRYFFTQQYQEELKRLLAETNPTSTPTQMEIDAQVAQWQKYLEAGGAAEEGRELYAGGAKRGAAGDAQARGKQTAVLNRAREGMIYADLAALDNIYPMPTKNATFADLWRAQVNLWVTQDLLSAINETNRQAFATLPEDERTVINAAVKRLTSLQIAENYIRPAAGDGPSASEIEEDEEYEESNFDMYMIPDAPEEMAERGEPLGGEPHPLTGRGSTGEYDVIRYELEVVISLSQLMAFERRVLAQNYHTILDVQWRSIHGPAVTGSGRRSGEKDDLFYYGTAPVVAVTLKGEVLFLTPWARGTWDEQAEEWSNEFPPLIPTQALRQQFGLGSSALRPEDKKRLEPLPERETAPPPPPAFGF